MKYLKSHYIKENKEDEDLFSTGRKRDKPFDNYTYKKIEQTLKNRINTVNEQKHIVDLFDCLDFADFPYIFRKKNQIWETPPDLNSRLSILASNRNTPAHHSGPDNLGNLGPVDSNQHFFTCRQIIRHIQGKMKI